jgi:hypothetical protein
MAKDKVVLAYSGGLDTSVCVKWLMDEKDLDVYCMVGEVGQEHDGLEKVRDRALKVGAKECVIADMRQELADEYLDKALAANAMYENKYPLLSALPPAHRQAPGGLSRISTARSTSRTAARARATTRSASRLPVRSIPPSRSSPRCASGT